MIKVYGREGCKPCNFVKMQLNQNQVPFEYIDATTGEGAKEFAEVRHPEKKTVPVVVYGENVIYDSKEIRKVIDWWNEQNET